MIKVEGKRKKGRIAIIIIFVFFVLSSVLYYESLFKPVDNNSTQKEIVIPSGSSTVEIAKILRSNNLIRSEWFFIIRARLYDNGVQMKAGKYLLSSNMTTDEIIKKLKDGKSIVDTIKFTIPEGFSVSEIADRLQQMGIVNKNDFINEAQNGVFNYDFLKNIPQNRPDRLEGYLFPDTYIVKKGLNAHDIINLMLSRFDEIYKTYIKGNETNVGMSTDKIIIIASMIEKEAKIDKDRPLIAGVIYNRLNKNMKLQIDATVEYALGKHKDKLSLDDLKINSPYNTYMNYGLPIGPISNPGLKSIEAALNPAKHDYYYYVAQSDGSHIFSKTYIGQLEAEKKVN
ncbi:ABC transporter substrate-binding protein [Thermoanaerobacterium thermosaccharolyticum]|uniref:Endolytic murein transglycosylase n=1 Tax=Thermoanaerobacterium thermosaccharolyticum TaxID=1517 RepID=A0A231VHL0_THETR|nr:endolytic transglycosylase MltG [Thermoanaerobacterium thermosaccharolyticum]OXT07674.1 ABC transporter substrate-binding protein [Thermoanaerobacterium thermosaccharolyticum]